MTNPTSNFGWQMPTPTDLVTDLPADFEVFGQAVDTSMADLKGGTTGQILSKATNTDMDFTWITNDVGDITNIAVTSPITGGGSSGSVTIGVDAATTSAAGVVQLSDSTSTTSSVLASTPTATKAAYDLANGAIAKTTVTTAGDIIYRNATVPTRLGIGTAGQVLTVNSGATAPEWAAAATGGGMTLISTTTLSGTSTSITVASNTYKDLVAYIYGVNPNGDATLTLRINGITTGVYQETMTFGQENGVVAHNVNNYTAMNLSVSGAQQAKASNNGNVWTLTFRDANSTVRKLIATNGNYTNTGSNNVTTIQTDVVSTATSAITNITVISTQSLTAGTVQLYGVK
jgi:hypothetical protein